MKLVCMFSGWFEIDADNVNLTHTQTGATKTAKEWFDEHGHIDGLILESFNDANSEATDGSFEELDLSIEEE